MQESKIVGSSPDRNFAKVVGKVDREKRAALREMVSEKRMQARLELKRKYLTQPLEKPS